MGGMPPARPRTTAEIMATMPSYTDRTGTVDMEAAMYPELYDTAQPTAIPAIPVIPPAAISPAITTPAIAPTPTALPSLTATRKVNFADVPALTTYDMTGQQYQDYLAEQRKGLTPRYDATGNIIGYDALDPDQAVVTSPTGQTMITKKALAPKPKKKKKKDKVVTPTLISQAEMLR